MKREKHLTIFLLVPLVVFIALNVRVGYAQPQDLEGWRKPSRSLDAPRADSYEISWYTIDGGGAQDLLGGTYSLSGTIGQPDAGSQSGGTHTLNGGYWIGVFGQQYYLPLIRK